MKSKFSVRSLVLLGLLTALVAVFSMTPIGSIPVGPLSITLNVIPVAIAAIALGPIGGAIMGGIFGLFSFLQCFGIGVSSPMGVILLDINPFFTFIQRFIPRVLDGFLAGLIFRGMTSVKRLRAFYIVTGLINALFGIALFISGMLLVSHDKNGKYKMSPELYGMMSSGRLVAFVCIFTGIICFLVGYLFVSSKKLSQIQVSCAVTGFSTAFLNTLFFMSALVLLFGNTEYLKEKIDGRNILLFIVTFVGVNALFEMVITTFITCFVGNALFKAKLIKLPQAAPVAIVNEPAKKAEKTVENTAEKVTAKPAANKSGKHGKKKKK
jgi:uncharacterized membrane protein